MSSFDFSHLSPKQRLALIGELWESLDADSVAITPAQKDELDRRLATLDEDIKRGRDADAIRVDLAKRFR
jgi:putative addiction module component (TIGR02574 family)